MKTYLIIAILLLTSCAAKKRAAEFDSQPAWVKQKPIIPGYYVGIGNARKVGTSSEYIAQARKDALADLAGEISSQISSSSVYHTIESKYGIAETFSQKIETTVQDYLEGFEPVEFFENEDSYWVYFRINKETYFEKKESKKRESVGFALAKYNSGLTEEISGRPKEALTFYLQGLQSIRDYLKEETPVATDSGYTDIGNQLFLKMDHLLSGLSIQSVKDNIMIKRGKPFDESIKFRVLFQGNPAQSIPIEFFYSGGFLKVDRVITDQNGFAVLNPEIINSKNKTEQISAQINLKEIASKAVDDVFIRGLVLKKSLQPAVVELVIEPPEISVRIDENSCQGDECAALNNVFQKKIISQNCQFADIKFADYVFSLNYSANPGKNSGGIFSLELKANLTLSDHLNSIWEKEITSIKGTGSNLQEARKKAFQELLNSLDRIYLPQGFEKINAGY